MKKLDRCLSLFLITILFPINFVFFVELMIETYIWYG